MGKQSRRKREWGRQQPGRSQPEISPRQEFQFALVEAHMEEIRDRGRPCLMCGEPARNPGLWTPVERLARYLGSQPGKLGIVVYALCPRCIDEPGVTRRVEEVIVADQRARLAAAEADLEIADGLTPFGGPDDVRRFAEAFARHKPPIGA